MVSFCELHKIYWQYFGQCCLKKIWPSFLCAILMMIFFGGGANKWKYGIEQLPVVCKLKCVVCCSMLFLSHLTYYVMCESPCVSKLSKTEINKYWHANSLHGGKEAMNVSDTDWLFGEPQAILAPEQVFTMPFLYLVAKLLTVISEPLYLWNIPNIWTVYYYTAFPLTSYFCFAFYSVPALLKSKLYREITYIK